MSGPATHGHQHGALHHHHDHNWHLSDGTGLHAPPCTLISDPNSGALCCHLCGEYFASLGAHVRSHGYTAATYRRAMGLGTTTALTSITLSNAITHRQSQRYATSTSLRADLEHGHTLARSGALTEKSQHARTAARPQTTETWEKALRAGRATQSERRQNRLTEQLRDLGATDLSTYVRAAHAAGATIDDIASATGLGRARLRTEMKKAGLELRPTGVNTLDGKRSRARVADAAAEALVGTDDLPGWLAQQQQNGRSLSELARLLGHSTHWVRWRIATVIPSTNEACADRP